MGPTMLLVITYKAMFQVGLQEYIKAFGQVSIFLQNDLKVRRSLSDLFNQ
jgi:hypothetical protein